MPDYDARRDAERATPRAAQRRADEGTRGADDEDERRRAMRIAEQRHLATQIIQTSPEQFFTNAAVLAATTVSPDQRTAHNLDIAVQLLFAITKATPRLTGLARLMDDEQD